MAETPDRPALRVDIISDVVCPWCAVGYHQLAFAARRAGVPLDIHWQPFELNPDMVLEGEDLREHLAAKYGSTAEQSAQVRAQLTELGEALGFTFRFYDGMRIYNTFQAHQLIEWAEERGKGHEMKQALLEAYFTDGKDISDLEVLTQAAESLGLDGAEARAALDSGKHGDSVRQREAFWVNQGIRGVPAMVFNGRHLVTGAQGVENYASILEQLMPTGCQTG
ncbi:DsbA family oxidoreductase [Leisingera methylohalidivorans]|uniref:Thioredoxin n=1 Tax=Leisingera methylohalidivorans DSM 14336 TaxID=999552 RepID=V9VV53_9RHOB|nr:DsbA family oxidoreductase [Leisingera methylohalidivorans]AHD01793.1 thioredoxin [Leisingera methylohalidivorans DSM 14336]